MLAVFCLFSPVNAAAPTVLGTTSAVQETGKTDKIRPGQEESTPPEYRDTYENYIATEANKAGVSPELALYIWKNEGQGNLYAIGDMSLTCRRTGLPVRARGGFQITECFHPEISDDCAFDLHCSTETVMPWIASKKRCIQEFSTCRRYYSK